MSVRTRCILTLCITTYLGQGLQMTRAPPGEPKGEPYCTGPFLLFSLAFLYSYTFCLSLLPFYTFIIYIKITGQKGFYNLGDSCC